MGKDRITSGMDFGVRVAAVVERGGALLLVCHKKPDFSWRLTVATGC